MLANQIECTRFEQRSVIKYLVAEKCKLCEIYRRICDVYGEACFSLKDIHKWAKHGFTSKSLSQKDNQQKRKSSRHSGQ